MKLYYLPGACPLATHIALNWANAPYELQAVSREEIKQPAYLALNPMGAVPVLVDGDLTLTQSAAILEYVAETHPEAGLMPDTPRERAEVRRWLGLINADIHRTFGNLFGAAQFMSTPEGQRELAEKSGAKLLGIFAIVDRQLEGKEWVAGARSIADPYLYTVMRWAKAKELDLSRYKNLQAFYARMEADPGVRKALKEQGL
ncbi:glutathione S-transferase family protein [Parapusillimonas granuli]|uniref:Glutathione S-transferase N-terminal domain-containing protein n=1 Tax=Parapusillimonas granuli TaxID=380911 RepID=A0A853G9Q2_9BURK|nr:glutathione S-transferase N-terminal domain-containing protein [Parapusillimonas granuli]MEB2399054.1 glutathione S-transferase N-terminal domain-containing protein [Alcaligenaceae bacterium]NYT51331.1 glutathione S-transferase N-terminal domain-containing protein [Parapusillimonas granuli]